MYKDPLLLKKLDAVIDPELGLPVTDMGLIYGITQDDRGVVHVTMTLTSIGCPLYDVIRTNIVDVLTADPSVTGVTVQLTFDPPWTPEAMTDAAKMDVGLL